jgi:hypothetical protein
MELPPKKMTPKILLLVLLLFLAFCAVLAEGFFNILADDFWQTRSLSLLWFFQQTAPGSGSSLVLDPTILSVIIGGAISTFGVFVGYWLAARANRDAENRRFRRIILKGVRSLISELDDNEECVKNGKHITVIALNEVRKEPWFFPPIISNSLEKQVIETYRLLLMYNSDIPSIMKMDSSELKEFIIKYDVEHLLSKNIKETKDQLTEVAQRLIPKI